MEREKYNDLMLDNGLTKRDSEKRRDVDEKIRRMPQRYIDSVKERIWLSVKNNVTGTIHERVINHVWEPITSSLGLVRAQLQVGQKAEWSD